MQADIRAATAVEMLAHELKYAPTHILTEDGIVPITEKPSAPSPIQVSLLEEPELLMTGVQWVSLAMEGRIAVAIEVGCGTDVVLAADVLALLPDQSKAWLTGWQQQVNSGSCWNTSGSIGRTAQNLMQQGFLLASKEPRSNYWQQAIPSRDQVREGTAGSAAFVRAIMGDAYLAWISAID